MGMKGSEGEKRSAHTISVVPPMSTLVLCPARARASPAELSFPHEHLIQRGSNGRPRRRTLLPSGRIAAAASAQATLRRTVAVARCSSVWPSSITRCHLRRPGTITCTRWPARLRHPIAMLSDLPCTHHRREGGLPSPPSLHSAWRRRGQNADEQMLSWPRWSSHNPPQGWPWSWPWFLTSGGRRDQEQVPDWAWHHRTCASS